MILAIITLYTVAAILVLVSLLTNKEMALRLRKVAYVVANDFCYTLVVFLSPNILTAILI